MTESLFIHLSSSDPGQTVEAIVIASDGSISTPTFTTPLDALAASFGELPLVVLIPGSEALCATAVLPKVRAGQILKMLPFALEEHIAGELDQQHFAMGRPSRSSSTLASEGLSVPVAILERQTLKRYVDTLRAVGLEPTQMLLDEECIAGKPGDVIAWVQNEEVFLRAPSGPGLRCRASDLSTTLDLLPSEPPLSTLGLQIVETGTTNERIKTFLEEAGRRFSRVTSTGVADSALRWLVAQRALAEPINLLQGEWWPRRSPRTLSKKWRLPIALAAALLVLIIIDHANTWWLAAAEEKRLDLAISQGGGDPNLSSTAQTHTPPLRRALLDLANAGVRDHALTSVVMDRSVIRLTLANGRSAEALIGTLSAAGWRVSPGKDEQGREFLTLTATQVAGAP